MFGPGCCHTPHFNYLSFDTINVSKGRNITKPKQREDLAPQENNLRNKPVILRSDYCPITDEATDGREAFSSFQLTDTSNYIQSIKIKYIKFNSESF